MLLGAYSELTLVLQNQPISYPAIWFSCCLRFCVCWSNPQPQRCQNRSLDFNFQLSENVLEDQDFTTTERYWYRSLISFNGWQAFLYHYYICEIYVGQVALEFPSLSCLVWYHKADSYCSATSKAQHSKLPGSEKPFFPISPNRFGTKVLLPFTGSFDCELSIDAWLLPTFGNNSIRSLDYVICFLGVSK